MADWVKMALLFLGTAGLGVVVMGLLRLFGLV